MKAIVIGTGSIGKRHLRNLKKLGIEELCAWDPDSAQTAVIQNEIPDIRVINNLEPEMQTADIVYVCSPNHLHARQAIMGAKNGCHLFIEKPVAHDLEDKTELCRLVNEKDLITMVGCNMKFYPAISLMKKILDKGTIGKILTFRVEVAIYLPNWRPHLDYRKNYGAHRSQGGGAILDMIHEIDYVQWLFGFPKRVACMFDKISDLEIDTEDIAEIILDYDGMVGNIHLDYLSKKYTRRVHIIGEKGNLYWDWHSGGVEHYDAESAKSEFYANPEKYDLNQMYLDETAYFLSCIKNHEQTFFNVERAFEVLELALLAKEASNTGKTQIFAVKTGVAS